MLDILYCDDDIVVCVKPPRVLSTDEPGGLPELLRNQLGTEDFRTVHRLDRVVSGLMVVARNAKAASDISRQSREDAFQKEYLAVIHGEPAQESGRLEDLLLRDKARKMTLVAKEMAKGVQPAALRYRVISSQNGMSRVRIQLETGRTHQIRVQFASRRHPLLGDGKYGSRVKGGIALQCSRLAFDHPKTGRRMEFELPAPEHWPLGEI